MSFTIMVNGMPLNAFAEDGDIAELVQTETEFDENTAENALRNSGKFIPWQVVTISRDGRILD